MDFAVLADHEREIKAKIKTNTRTLPENEKQQQKNKQAKVPRHRPPPKKKRKPKLWNMRVTVISIVVGSLGTLPKGHEKGVKRIRNPK